MRIRLSTAFTINGRSYNAGDVVEVDQATADGLVNLKIGERVTAAAGQTAATGTPVALNDDQYERLFSDPDDAEIEAEANRIAAEQRDQNRRGTPPLVPNSDGGSIAFKSDYNLERGWRLRATRYFNALALESEDKDQGKRAMRTLQRQTLEMPDEQARGEERIANDLIQRAVADGQMSRDQSVRLSAALEIGIFSRLHTTSTTDTAKAGLLLPKPFLAEVFVIVERYGVARRLFRAIPMVSKDIDLKNIASKVVAYWTDEGVNFTASDLGIGAGKLATKKLAGITSWTEEQDEDEAIALLPLLMESFAEAFMLKEDTAGIVGTGVAGTGGFTGVLNLAGAQVITLDAGQETGDSLKEKNLRKAKQKLSLARRDGIRWLMHPSYEDVVEQLENTAGFRVFRENITGSGADRLLGYPIEYSEVMPSVDDTVAETKFAILGNFSRMLMGQRRGLTADISEEAVLQNGDGDIVFNAFQADGKLLRMSERVAFAGAPGVQDGFVVLKTAAAA